MGAGTYGRPHENVGGVVSTIREKYGLNELGLIGERSNHAGVRLIKSDDPDVTSLQFFKDITKDAVSIKEFKDDKGNDKGLIAIFRDGSRINHRKYSTSSGPAADINIIHFEGIRSQKIHFEKR